MENYNLENSVVLNYTQYQFKEPLLLTDCIFRSQHVRVMLILLYSKVLSDVSAPASTHLVILESISKQ